MCDTLARIFCYSGKVARGERINEYDGYPTLAPKHHRGKFNRNSGSNLKNFAENAVSLDGQRRQTEKQTPECKCHLTSLVLPFLFDTCYRDISGDVLASNQSARRSK